jgi:hypothetical protein
MYTNKEFRAQFIKSIVLFYETYKFTSILTLINMETLY